MERVSMFMQADSHAGNGSPASQSRTEHVNVGYMIRSLYFDDCYECAYEEKLAGVEARSKYRIRIYNYSDSIIKLECKHKEGSIYTRPRQRLPELRWSRLFPADMAF